MRLSVRCMAVAIAPLWRLERSASLLLFSNFSKFLEKLVYTTYVKRMYNVIYVYIGIVKPAVCFEFILCSNRYPLGAVIVCLRVPLRTEVDKLALVCFSTSFTYLLSILISSKNCKVA